MKYEHMSYSTQYETQYKYYYSEAGVGKMIPFTIPGFQTPCGTILGTVNEP